jgi:hypothetical protein
MRRSEDEIETIASRKEKVCTGCGLKKNIQMFGKRSMSVDGREARCLECHKIRQAKYRAQRKPFELHVNGMVFRSKDVTHLERLAAMRGGKIFEVYRSNMNKVPHDFDIERIPKDVTSTERPRHVARELLTYSDVQKAAQMVSRGKTRSVIAKALHCSLDKLRTSLAHYHMASNQQDYENYRLKDFLENSK